MKRYKVNIINASAENILNSEDSLWKNANSLIDFSSPWNHQPIKKIEFKALHDKKEIFFQFKVFDNDIYIHPSKNKYKSINNSDRVELFFRSDENLNPYYCLEIDPTARVMNFKASPNKQFDFTWNWPEKHLKVVSYKSENYFTVNIAVSIQSFKDLSLLKGNNIETGIFRAKYNKIENTKDYKPTWITWVNPNTIEPNFHIKSSFGLLELESYN